MSIIGGLVDAHHETELSPSVQLVTNNWLSRHLWAIILVGAAIVLAFVF